MSTYMLLLYDNPAAFANVTPEQMQQVIGEYIAWAQKLGQEGKLEGGQKLKDEGGKVLRGAGKQTSVVDGPYSETKEVIGGYYLIKAKDYQDAVEIAKTCPHVKYGPKVEVREIDPMT
jgi:hypothetical protein